MPIKLNYGNTEADDESGYIRDPYDDRWSGVGFVAFAAYL
jgi:hypothetical protein